MSNALAAKVSCLRCGGELVPVAVGRIIAGREGSVIMSCSRCHIDHHIHVVLSLVSDELDTNLNVFNPIAVCGTEGGYARHRRMGTEICKECRSAHAAGNRRRAQRVPVAV